MHLRRVDPARGMWRYYSLALQPTLLGGVDLVRRWGRIGTAGGAVLIVTYPDEIAARTALERLAASKRRSGYAERPAPQVMHAHPDEAGRARSVRDVHGSPCHVLPLLTPLASSHAPSAEAG